MDFLKSCTTNLRVVDNLAAIPCEAFTWPTAQNETERTRLPYKAISKLRAQSLLCSLHDGRLCVFGPKLEDIKAALEELGYRQAAVTEQQRPTALLDAIEASLAYKLAAAGLTHIAPWTWLFYGSDADSDSGDSSTVIDLHAKLGSNGALFVSSTMRTSGLLPRSSHTDANKASGLLLAPSGRLAKTPVGPHDDETPTVGSTAWKSSVSEILQAEGVELDDKEQWVEVEFDHDATATRLLWPSRLCFQSSTVHDDGPSAIGENWKKWFISPAVNGDVFRDPLAAVEAWFTGAAQREISSSSDALQSADPTGLPAPPDATADLVTSPPFNQRTVDQQAAMGGIYPTPPDGLLPGTQGTQPMPISESSAMPPINESSELLPGEEMQGLRRSISSSHTSQGGFHRSDDDLFGDMGEIDFGGNEVGDADFDYFDEPDEETGNDRGANEAAADAEMADAASSHPPGEVEQTAHESAPDQETHPAPDTEPQGSERPAKSKDEEHLSTKPPEEGPTAVVDSTAAESETSKKPERPLSPFGIRERLLPPPIPASKIRAESENKGSLRRSSAFGPVTFNEGLGLAAKYSSRTFTDPPVFSHPRKVEPDASLPPKQKNRVKAPAHEPESDGSDEDTNSSTAGSFESETSVSDNEPPYKMPWESRKRKRTMNGGADAAEYEQALAWMHASVDGHGEKAEISAEKMGALQATLVRTDGDNNTGQSRRRASASHVRAELVCNRFNDRAEHDDDDLLPIDQQFDELDDLDLVYVAQLVSEQSVSVVPHLVQAAKLNTTPPSSDSISCALQPLLEQALSSILPTAATCDLAKLALPRDTGRQLPSQSGKGPHPVQRPPQRSESVQQGPDYSPIPPPYIRVQRYGDLVEMLPPALHFWSTLGLSPASGTKDVRVVSIVPGNTDLVRLLQEFISDLKLVYEANKLGSWKAISGLNDDDSQGLIMHDESTVLVQPDTPEDVPDSADVLQSYESTCRILGKALAAIGHDESDRTILVCIVSPFHSARAQQLLCACFWMIYKAYRDNAPKAHRTAQRSDIVLRVLPCELLAHPDGLVILDQQQYAQLAMEIHNRCPPSGKAAANKDIPAALTPYFAAPAVELALPIPRRIPFQLTADPPGGLLHENSVLHLAYTISEDREWMCFSWIDGSGRFASQMSACLRGKSIADVVAEGWERTGEWLRARDVTWRVYVVGVGVWEGEWEASVSLRACWREVVEKKARRLPLHVVFLEVELEPEVELVPPAPLVQVVVGGGSGGEKAGQGFLTPVTTPSGTSMTVSPDASAAAPLTPDPAAESDGDAHLVDVADESWGLMLSPAFANPSPAHPNDSPQPPLANGMLLRRGPTSDSALESLAVSLHWDIRLRPNGTVDEGPVRQAEYTLREVLKLYRNLAVLGRVRGLSVGGKDGKRESGVVPVHVVGVLRARGGLEGMLG